MSQQFWDEMYTSRDQIWSGAPNGVLVAEVTDLAPGRALDVGCGEGADSLWLAENGWRVTAVDVSQVALDRAAQSAKDATLADEITWTRTDLTAAPPPTGSFDLVSVHYFPIPRSDTALDGLLAAVAPGGTLLVVSHALADLAQPPDHGPDPRDYYQPDDIAAFLGNDWTIQVNEHTRERVSPAPEGTHHVHDTVFRARRLR